MNLAHLLQRQASIAPERPAILNGTQVVATHGQWAQRCQHLARQFQAAGLQPGDRVALFMRNHVRTLEVIFAAWWAGLAVVPINAKLHLREAQWIIANAQARNSARSSVSAGTACNCKRRHSPRSRAPTPVGSRLCNKPRAT